MNDSVGVDHIAHKHLIAPLVRLDLITDSGFSLLMELVSNPNCMYVHFAPPCGTASRARDIQRHGQRMPARARSDEHPDGLPDLEPSLKARVEAANTLYEATAKAVKACVNAGKLVSVENPGRSYFWQTSKWCEFAQGLDLEETFFHHCQFGGDRNKLTRLAHNIPEFHQLAILCPGESASHKHKPWGFRNGAWATSEETAYPTELCRRMSELVAQALARVGMPAQPLPHDHRAAQAATAVQPTGKKLGPLVPEFKRVITVFSHVPIPELQADKLSSACQLPPSAQSSNESTIASGARVLRRFQARGVTTSQDPLEEVEEGDRPDSLNCGNPMSSRNCGNPKSPVVHVDPAGPSVHPPDSANSFKLRNPPMPSELLTRRL